MTKDLKRAAGGSLVDVLKFIALSVLVTLVICLLSACAASAPHIDAPRPIYVDRPVYSPCITRADAEKIEADRPRKIGGHFTGDAVRDGLLLGAKAIRQEAWADKTMAIIKRCSG